MKLSISISRNNGIEDNRIEEIVDSHLKTLPRSERFNRLFALESLPGEFRPKYTPLPLEDSYQREEDKRKIDIYGPTDELKIGLVISGSEDKKRIQARLENDRKLNQYGIGYSQDQLFVFNRGFFVRNFEIDYPFSDQAYDYQYRGTAKLRVRELDAVQFRDGLFCGHNMWKRVIQETTKMFPILETRIRKKEKKIIYDSDRSLEVVRKTLEDMGYKKIKRITQ